jgi:hypothetical protein
MADDAPLWRLIAAIASADDPEVLTVLISAPALARARVNEGATRPR